LPDDCEYHGRWGVGYVQGFPGLSTLKTLENINPQLLMTVKTRNFSLFKKVSRKYGNSRNRKKGIKNKRDQ
jgi:hypothetical protein